MTEHELENKVDNIKIHKNTDEFISGLDRSENGTIPIDILQFHHSYGYNCQKYFNYCVADPDTIIFGSGSLINIFDTVDKTFKFRRGSTGRGIGHITKNPTIPHIAVGEIGIDPPIIIYQWPNFDIVTILSGGTTRFYSHLTYSPDGDLLTSQGGNPDYLITIWNWKKSSIILRCKSHSQDIHNVIFSSSIAGHLITSGSGHIKFWQMASTFTGLKLKGELGRFGRTEISDIIGILAMPDGKVVSGCEWGNILLWDEGLIKLEVRRKNKKSCHDKMITQFEYNNGELMSIGMDGWIRIWYYETIDQADPPYDDRFIDVEPIYEYKIDECSKRKNDDMIISSMLMGIQKKYPDNPDDALWYAQDGSGGFWLINLSTFQLAIDSPPQKLFTCHAGAVNDISSCTRGEFFATCGEDGRLNVYNYIKKIIIGSHKFRDSCSCVIWLPCAIESTGSTIVCAFNSGILRMVMISLENSSESETDTKEFLRLIQVIKPHTKSITSMSVNSSNSLLVTGSVDSTIFVFSIKNTEKYPMLIPIGFINMPSGVTCMSWRPQNSTIILMGCLHGECVEIDLIDVSQSNTTVSYELIGCKTKKFKFHSVKSKIHRESVQIKIEENKAARKQIFYKKIEEMKAINPAIEIDENTFLMDTEEDPPLPDIYIPQIPNRVLTINYSTSGTIYLTMSGFDAGFIYEYPIPQNSEDITKEPIKYFPIHGAYDTEIHSCLFYENKYVFLGTSQGEIHVCRLKDNNIIDSLDYWILPMHDTYSGYISKMILSHDKKMLFTCGHDGNIFSFVINDDDGTLKIVFTEFAAPPQPLPMDEIDDIEDTDHPNLEQIIQKNEENRIMLEAKKRKENLLMTLQKMSEEYRIIMEKNISLLKSQQIPPEYFELDPRITEDLNNQLKSEMDLMHKKMAFKVEKCRLALERMTAQFIKPVTCIPFGVSRILNPKRVVYSLQEKKLNEHDDLSRNFSELLEQVEKNESSVGIELTEQNNLINESSNNNSLIQIDNEMEEQRMTGVENFLEDITVMGTEYSLSTQINHMLKKYRDRKAKMDKRAQEWKIMNACKPDRDATDHEDIDAIEQAKQTIGNYKLKVSEDFHMNKKLENESILSKYKQFLQCRKKTHYLRVNFNDQLRAIRDKKLKLQNEIFNLIGKLKSIHVEIPEKYIKPLPEIIEINHSFEYPEKHFEFEKYITVAEKVEEARRIRKSIVDETKVVPMDEEYEMLLLDEKLIEKKLKNNKKIIFPANTNIYKAEIRIPHDVMVSLNNNNCINNVWEHEMKLARIGKKIYEQDEIINYINTSYKTIDRELDELEHQRLTIQSDSCYSELYQLSLHQELNILYDCEAKEKLLIEEVNENLKAQTIIKQKIQHKADNIDNKNREIVKFHDKIRELSSEFFNIIKDNKFAEFFRRVFKKKYKLPKLTKIKQSY